MRALFLIFCCKENVSSILCIRINRSWGSRRMRNSLSWSYIAYAMVLDVLNGFYATFFHLIEIIFDTQLFYITKSSRHVFCHFYNICSLLEFLKNTNLHFVRKICIWILICYNIENFNDKLFFSNLLFELFKQ